MITRAQYAADGTVTAGPIDGVEWSGITPEHRFWQDILQFVAAGGFIEAYVPPPAPPRQIYKADIFRRADDDEAETIVTILGQQSIRLQQIWANAQYVSTDDDFYPMIEGAFIQAFGAQRAAELLA